MPHKALNAEHYEILCSQVCRELSELTHQKYGTPRVIRKAFDETNTALMQVEMFQLDTFRYIELRTLVENLQKNAALATRLAETPFNIKVTLERLQKHLQQQDDERLRDSDALALFLHATKLGWQRCSEQGYDSMSFVSKQRYYLGVTFRVALTEQFATSPASAWA